jgi:signal transduction histidine kinase
LTTRLSGARREAILPHAIVQSACQALAEQFPGCCIAVFRRRDSEPGLRLICGVNLPAAWVGPGLTLIDAALQHPEQVVEGHGSAGHGGGGDPRNASPIQNYLASLTLSGVSRYVLVLAGPWSPEDHEPRKAAVDLLRRLLSPMAPAGSAGGWPTLAAVHRAKLEWEHTADTLPEIVGLLDLQGRVVRVSRAVERWEVNAVQAAIGSDLHRLLHRSCADPDCPVSAALVAARDQLKTEQRVSFEVEDPHLQLDIVVTLNAPRLRPGSVARAAMRTVFTVANVTSLRTAERELRAINQNLELRVAERTGALLATNQALRNEVRSRVAAEKQLRKSKSELEALSDRLVTVQEGERKRISQDLHDSVGQTLSAIKYSLERAQLLSRRNMAAEASGVLDITIGRVQRLMAEVRAISLNLRPLMLDDLGAASAVRFLCRDWHDVYSSIGVDVDVTVADADIPADCAVDIYRAVQEALNNVARHSGANQVKVSMHLLGGTLALSVRDNGNGFNFEAEAGASFGSRGLRSLRERAERAGGSCEVTSSPGQGTVVELKLPILVGEAARLANASLN